MALYITEAQVDTLVTMPEAIDALESAFFRQGEGAVINQSRRRLHMPDGTFHLMTCADLELQTFSVKLYASYAPKTRFLILLYSAINGDLLAVIEADRLGQIRTGAASAVASKRLVSHDALATGQIDIGIIGTGWQAESQLEALCAALPVKSITAYGRHVERCSAFADRMTRKLSVVVTPASEPEEAVTGKAIVTTATTSKEPVFEGEWLSPGTHVNAVGSNLLMKREIDIETIRRSGLVIVDSIEQAKQEAGDLIPAFEKGVLRWERVSELNKLVCGEARRESADQITLFKSIGIALEDTAVATAVYQRAVEHGVGTLWPMWQGN